MHAAMSDFLKGATAILCSFLGNILPSLSDRWWDEHVLRKLTIQQQRFVKENNINSLSKLDFLALLRVLDSNWYPISERKFIPSNARNYIKEMYAVRNRVAHPTTEEPKNDEVYRDLDTLQRFAIIIEADGEFIERVKNAKEKVFLRPVDFELPPRQRRPRRRIIRSTPTDDNKSPETSRSGTTTRRPRDPELEAALKASVCQLLKDELQDKFIDRSGSQFVFKPSGKRFLVKYSSYSRDHDRWFWGVSSNYWTDWGAKDHLVLILENEVGQGYSYLLLNPQQSKELLKNCSESNGEKKINMRMYETYREVRLQELQELIIKNMINPLPYVSSSLSGR